MRWPEYAKLAKPLFDQVERLNYITGPSARFAAYMISEEMWRKLHDAAEKDREDDPPPRQSLQNEKMARYGFMTLMYRGIPVMYSTELEGDQVVPIQTDLVRGLNDTIPAYDVIDTRPREDWADEIPKFGEDEV